MTFKMQHMYLCFRKLLTIQIKFKYAYEEQPKSQLRSDTRYFEYHWLAPVNIARQGRFTHVRCAK